MESRNYEFEELVESVIQVSEHADTFGVLMLMKCLTSNEIVH